MSRCVARQSWFVFRVLPARLRYSHPSSFVCLLLPPRSLTLLEHNLLSPNAAGACFRLTYSGGSPA